MNVLGRSKGGISSIGFNQDCSFFFLATNEGFHIYSVEPFAKCFYQAETVGLVELLYNTSLLAFYGMKIERRGSTGSDSPLLGLSGSPVANSPLLTYKPQSTTIAQSSNLSPLTTLSARTLVVYNMKTEAVIYELNFAADLLNVKMNKKRLVAVTEAAIFVYDISTMKLLHTVITSPNPKGLCALSPADNSLLAYPNNGDILIFDALSLRAVTVIEKAHHQPVSVMAFNPQGTALASASAKGTVIRIFDAQTAIKTREFRRGTSPATVYSISFSPDSSLLCVTSDHGTIHVFSLSSNSSSVMSGYLPEVISGMLDYERAIYQVKLPYSGVPSVCGIASDNSRLAILTAYGHLYFYKLDPLHSDCKLSFEHNLLGSSITSSLSST